MKSPVKWVGSKRQLAKEIVKMIPEHICYVEPFVGGGSILFEKDRSKVEVINDINGNLINFYKIMQNKSEDLIYRIDNSLISRELFMEYRNSNWNELDDIERAFRFYYITKCSFGGLFRFNQKGECNSPFASSPSPKAKSSLHSHNTEKSIREGFKRIKGVLIENIDYKEIVKKFDKEDTFFFFDPPYDTDYSYGIKFDYDELLDICRNIKGKFILTLNSELKDKFDEFYILETEVSYSVTCKSGCNKKSEIIIKNY